MREELLGKEVLAMYDIRGIQSYIFKTNAVKEIIGASKLVDDIIINGLKSYVKDRVLTEERDLYLVDWHNEATADAFIKNDSKVLMQVMFVGGGNAYVLFRNGSIRVVPVKIENRSVAYDFRLRNYPLSHHHASAASSCPPRCPCSLR